MIIKNIIIEDETKGVKIQIADSNMQKSEVEKRTSEIFDRLIELCVKDKRFKKEILE